MIAKMDKLSCLIYHKEYESFLEKLRELGVVHVEIRQGGEMDERLHALLSRYKDYQALLKEMSSTSVVNGGEEGSCSEASADSIEQTSAGHEDLLNQEQALNQRLQAVDREIAQLEIWGEFSWEKLGKIEENGWKVRFFTCQEKAFDEEWGERYYATVIAKVSGTCYFITVSPDPVEIEAEELRLPPHSLSECLANRSRLLEEIEDNKKRLAAFNVSHLPVVRDAMRDLRGEIDLLKVKLGGERMAEGAVILLNGWIPAENEEQVRSLLETNGVYYELRPAEKEDNAPIKLRNNKVTGFFEMLTRMYGLPDYGEFDPTPLLAPFYALFFGYCVGDAGYGLFLIALGFYLRSKAGKSMRGILNLLITLGAATTIVGALVGTFFGVELVKLDLPEWLKQCMITGKFGDTAFDKTMIAALIIGMVHICFAMFVKAICSTARYGFTQSLSAWGWLLFVGGSVTIGTLNYLQLLPFETAKIAFLAIAGVSAIGIYLLNNIRRNVFLNVGAGLWDTYNMATGLMGDLLSYLRLYALGLAGGMLGGVFNTLGMQLRDSMDGLLWGIPGWICFGIIFVAGHGLNIALSCLSGYVHSIRLTFVEYFKNSGYDGRGVPYTPFSVVTKEEDDK